MLIAPIENEKFKYVHLLSSLQNIEDIKSFSVAKETGKGLEFYLKERAEAEERTGENRTYLVRDKETNELAAYFSLHTKITNLNIETDKIENDVKILLVSDIHAENVMQTFHINKIIKTIEKEKPDFVIIA